MSNSVDHKAAMRMLASPVTSLMIDLVRKGLLSADEVTAALQTRESTEICGPQSQAAYEVLSELEVVFKNALKFGS